MTNPFKKLAKTKPAKPKKNDTPEIGEGNIELAKFVKTWLQADKEGKDAAAKKGEAEVPILEAACSAHEEVCMDEQAYHSSIKVVTPEGNVMVSFTNNYSSVDPENEEELRRIYGDDYDRYFKEKTVVTLTPAAMEDEEFVQTISKQLGPEKFARYFNVTEHLEVNKSVYHETRSIDKILASKHKQAVDAGLVRCNKPSLKWI